jgi:hypothetical protein
MSDFDRWLGRVPDGWSAIQKLASAPRPTSSSDLADDLTIIPLSKVD